jgi:hypothetical protein
MQVHLTLKSANAKTGPIPVSTTSAASCPTVCPFRRKLSADSGKLESFGCYADGGPLAIHWREVTEQRRGGNWSVFCATIAKLPDGQLWRHNQAGDLPMMANTQTIDARAVRKLISANKGKRGFTYTHHDMSKPSNWTIVAQCNAAGFTVNLSANDLRHADELANLNIGPVVVVLPSDAMANTETPAGRKVVVCPATQRDDIDCAKCQLCARQREVIIGFPAHGAAKRKASVIAIRAIN